MFPEYILPGGRRGEASERRRQRGPLPLRGRGGPTASRQVLPNLSPLSLEQLTYPCDIKFAFWEVGVA
jgi:hypothetical protein